MKRITYIIAFALLAIGATAQEKQGAKGQEALPATVRIDKTIAIFNDVFRQLDAAYTDTLNYDLLVETAVGEMLKKIDPYTIYMPARANDDLKRLTTGKYGGIGSTIMQRDGAVYVSDPYEGLPAQQHDVRAGDKILRVDGTDCKGLGTAEVSGLLRGTAGTTVELLLERPGEKKPIKKAFLRKEIKLPTVDFYGMLTPTVGYISFTEFTEGSARDFRLALDELCQAQGCQHLIIDLRGNGGGLISEAVSILSYFLPKGTAVVSTKGKVQSSAHTYKTTTEPLYPTLPLTVMVNGQSASASEITCGALQDLHRATLIGQKTFGKGLVQNIRPIAFGGHLKVTTARYYLPSGRCIQGTGIEPDITLSDSSKVNITYELYRKNLFFDYATRFFYSHPTYERPSTLIPTALWADSLNGEVPLTAADSTLLADFEAYLGEQQFTYQTETSKYFADVLRFAKQEDLDAATMADLQALSERLATTYHAALWNNAHEVLNLLEGEIASRYYFQRGRTAVTLKQDSEVHAALRTASAQ